MKIYIKNMVCNRCIEAVRKEFRELRIKYNSIELGEVSTIEDISEVDLKLLNDRLCLQGFEILKDKDKKTIEKVKNIVIGLVYEEQSAAHENLSESIAKQLNQDYSMISRLFSEIEGTTIEKYVIKLRIERVKELLIYDELTLSQIADKLHYSSVAYLSSQFKKVTGLKPSFFKKNRNKVSRTPIDKI